MQSAPSLESQYKGPDPVLAAVLSVVPGCGQIYNGERRKGILFLIVTLFNLVPLSCCLFRRSLNNVAIEVASSSHLRLNERILNSLQEIGTNSPQFFVLLALFIGFVVFAMMDAYKRADSFKRARYVPSFDVETSEATSGSYIAHSSLIAMFFVYCFAFCLPPHHIVQTVDIEFEQAGATSPTRSSPSAESKLPIPLPASSTAHPKPIPLLSSSLSAAQPLPQSSIHAQPRHSTPHAELSSKAIALQPELASRPELTQSAQVKVDPELGASASRRSFNAANAFASKKMSDSVPTTLITGEQANGVSRVQVDALATEMKSQAKLTAPSAVTNVITGPTNGSSSGTGGPQPPVIDGSYLNQQVVSSPSSGYKLPPHATMMLPAMPGPENAVVNPQPIVSEGRQAPGVDLLEPVAEGNQLTTVAPSALASADGGPPLPMAMHVATAGIYIAHRLGPNGELMPDYFHSTRRPASYVRMVNAGRAGGAGSAVVHLPRTAVEPLPISKDCFPIPARLQIAMASPIHSQGSVNESNVGSELKLSDPAPECGLSSGFTSAPAAGISSSANPPQHFHRTITPSSKARVKIGSGGELFLIEPAHEGGAIGIGSGLEPGTMMICPQDENSSVIVRSSTMPDDVFVGPGETVTIITRGGPEFGLVTLGKQRNVQSGADVGARNSIHARGGSIIINGSITTGAARNLSPVLISGPDHNQSRPLVAPRIIRSEQLLDNDRALPGIPTRIDYAPNDK